MMSNDERLIYMLNQITRNFQTMDAGQAAEATAEHVIAFWDPRMRQRIFELAAIDGTAIGEIGRETLTILARAEHSSAR